MEGFVDVCRLGSSLRGVQPSEFLKVKMSEQRALQSLQVAARGVVRELQVRSAG